MSKPLIFEHGAAATVFFAAAGVWLVFELVMSVRQRRLVGRRVTRDPSALAIWIAIVGPIYAAVALGRARVVLWPGGRVWPYAAGVALLVSGVALRAWSIATLGRFFQYRIAIQPGHRVVTSGPYRFVRHPSYSGLALALLGYALAAGSVIGFIVAVALGGAGVAVRIRAEERQLHDALGGEYDAFAAARKRLIPGLF